MKTLLALPKEGRLQEDVEQIFNQAGFSPAETKNKRHIHGSMTDLTDKAGTFDIIRRKSTDALKNIDLGLTDMAVVGLDKFTEFSCRARNEGRDFPAAITVSFNECASCRLSVAAPKDAAISDLKDLAGRTIATSYPETIKRCLDESGVDDVTIYSFEGGIESYAAGDAPLADAIVDIVDSGRTLEAYGLEEKFILYESSAVLVTRSEPDPLTIDKVEEIQKRLKALCQNIENSTDIEKGKDIEPYPITSDVIENNLTMSL